MLKVLRDEIDKREYENKHKFFQKRPKDCCIQPSYILIKIKRITSFHKQKNSLQRKDI